jgi:hypothetical protein
MRKKLIRTFILFIIYLIVYFFSLQPLWVEKYYTNGFYKKIIHPFFKTLFGWLPFSLGDILYIIFIGYALYKVFVFFRNKHWKHYKLHWKRKLLTLIHNTLIVLLVFNISWGLNYSRPGIAHQLQLKQALYSTADVVHVIDYHKKIIAAMDSVSLANEALFTLDLCKQELAITYNQTTNKFPFLGYQKQTIKKSLFGKLGNYLGYLGYFNPITHEAQINNNIPYFIRPFTTMHEIAHQLGYANESEANFISYLACTNSNNNTTKYAAAFEVLLYSLRELRIRDSVLFKQQIENIPGIVKKHYAAYIAYNKKYENPIELATLWLYDKYLKSNKQSSGTKSYSELIGWLIAYYKKFGSYP